MDFLTKIIYVPTVAGPRTIPSKEVAEIVLLE